MVASGDRLDDQVYQAMARFRYALRRFLRFSERVAKEAGVTPRQYQLMLAIRGNAEREALTISEIAEQLQIQHHSAVELVDRAVDRGLVARARGEGDRRERYVSLTPEGRDLVRCLASQHRGELERLRRWVLGIPPIEDPIRSTAGAVPTPPARPWEPPAC